MKTKEKVAVARILVDLIMADRIVDTGEMECWRELCKKYDLDKEVEVAARDITFADALATICTSEEKGLRSDLLGDCRRMMVSDGFCAHSEALLMIALMLMLDDSQPCSVDVMSIPKASFNIDIATALYIESDYDTEVNDAIRKGYRTIFKELQLAGIHFVYLPSIIKHYRDTEPWLLRSILSFLAPSISEEGIENAYRDLLQMTTGRFCKDLLCNKLGITDLRNTYPSLLIKIGNGFVGETAYASYLKLEVGEDIVTTVQTFVDRFSEMLQSDVFVVNTSEERDNQFHFHGFYKQLLDIFLIRKNIRSTIVIDPRREEITFPEIDAKATGMHRREKALYTLLLCQGSDGVDFSKPKTAEGLARFDKRMRTMQSRYAEIYAMFGGVPEGAPDLGVPDIRRPIVACVRRSIARLNALYNPEDYNITKDGGGVFSVHVEPELVYVRELESDKPVALKESELYRRWARE